MSAYPEHDKLRAADESGQLDTVREFLDFLLDEKKFPARGSKGEEMTATARLVVTSFAIETYDASGWNSKAPVWKDRWREYELDIPMGDLQRANLIGEFLGIDPKKLETEKRAMLDEIRSVA